MVLICPSCATGFQVAAEALGSDGRNVRCARCRTVWFAEAALLVAEPADDPNDLGTTVEMSATDIQPASGDIIVCDAPPLSVAEPELASPTDISMDEPAPPVRPAPARKPAWRNLVWRGRERSAAAGSRLAVATLVLAGIVIAAVVSPATFVRVLPDLAGLYAAAGMPVNLRGLEFRELRTTRETHDGITLLVAEGKITNVSGQELELPRIRLALVGAGGQELYAWTATASRARLGDGDTIPFKSRLASPPAEARQVLVRFLGRDDLAWSMR